MKTNETYQDHQQPVQVVVGHIQDLDTKNLNAVPTGSMTTVFKTGVLNPHQEKDPFGKNQNELGAKVDAGKDEYDLVMFSFPNALAHVDRVGKFGARKYTKGGFIEVPNGQVRYFNAEMRHANKHLSGELRDPDSNELHLAHKAWNALAELELFLRGKGKPTT